ncbi:hypothetical protein [Desulfuromonas sp. TF]|uniref:hypothetical protein n=1 Tax=Desulfuromonas sp. TF TaxID=1232410 RepID=UPI001D052A31|nr:hypothetical protein [Desulfuromonas sp. TF]
MFPRHPIRLLMRLPVFIGIRIPENEREHPEKEVPDRGFCLVGQGDGLIDLAEETADFIANSHNPVRILFVNHKQVNDA